MKNKVALNALLLILLVFPIIDSVALPDEGPDGPAQSAGAASAGQEILRVYEGKSMVVNSPVNFKRVSVTNETVATAIVVSPTQVLIHGVKAGSITLLLWNEQEQLQSFELQVVQIPMELESLRATMGRLLPGENIQVSQSGSSVVLTGTVSNTAVADQALALAKTENPNVVNLLGTPKMDQVVLLQVKFAEIDRNTSQQLGVNLFSTGALNTIGAVSTQQFSPPTLSSVKGGADSTNTFNLGDMLNIFIFRPDLNLGMTIKALQQKALLQILAEPNLLASGGKEASFLAGGEFPVPIVTGSTGTPVVSIQFKEFGIRLKFTAEPMPDGIIRLKVAPEVSTLDYNNAVTLSGFLIPAMQTRRAETEVQLRDGQSFAIAGLMDNRIIKTMSKVPWLGDVPLLGKLFQSMEFRKSNSELLVVVTPKLVKPLEAGQVPPGPYFPLPLLDSRKFDGRVGEPAPQETVKKP